MAFVARPRTQDTGVFRPTSLSDAIGGGHESENVPPRSTGGLVGNGRSDVYYAPNKSPYGPGAASALDVSISAGGGGPIAAAKLAGRDLYSPIQLTTFREEQAREESEQDQQRTAAELRERAQRLEEMLGISTHGAVGGSNVPFRQRPGSSATRPQATIAAVANNNSSVHNTSVSFSSNNNNNNNNGSNSAAYLYPAQNVGNSPSRRGSTDAEQHHSPGTRMAVFRLPPGAAAEAGLPSNSSMQINARSTAYHDRVQYESERAERQAELREVLSRLESHAERLARARKEEEEELAALSGAGAGGKKSGSAVAATSAAAASHVAVGAADGSRRENPLLKTKHARDVIKKINALEYLHDNVPRRGVHHHGSRRHYDFESSSSGSESGSDDGSADSYSQTSSDEENRRHRRRGGHRHDRHDRHGRHGRGADGRRSGGGGAASVATGGSRKAAGGDLDFPSVSSGTMIGGAGSVAASSRPASPARRSGSRPGSPSRAVEEDASVRRRVAAHHRVRLLHLQEEEVECREMIERSYGTVSETLRQALFDQLHALWERERAMHEARTRFLAQQARLHEQRVAARQAWRASSISETADEITFLRSISPRRGDSVPRNRSASRAPGQHPVLTGAQSSLLSVPVPAANHSFQSASFGGMSRPRQHSVPPLPVPFGGHISAATPLAQHDQHMSRSARALQAAERAVSPQQRRKYKHKLMQDLLSAPLNYAEAVSP